MELRPHIRPCRPEDQARMREICAVCDDPSRPERLSWVLPMYLDYYVERCASTCFVAADESDRPVGYILCAPSYKAYRKDFRKSGTLKTVFSHSFIAWFCWLVQPLVERRFHRPPYLAHLHIDIFPAYQRMGLGHELMDALVGKLSELSVPGVMLGCLAANEKGRRFYESYGFTALGTAPGEICYGLAVAPDAKKSE